ncbi:YdiY family protein [Hydrogenovibrio sp. JE_KL2]|uniref:DUF481 domain-containing protein n=1 Tax=Hydrogenovibrio sp. JE_KL2 TaxID=2651188 RepID=UPI00352B1F26
MKFTAKRTLLISLMMASTAAIADTKKYGTSGSGEVGLSDSTGNTPSSSIYSSLRLKYLQKMYQLKGLVEANNKSENGVRTKERYVGDLQGNLFFSDYQKAYGFGQTRWESDHFSDIDLNSYYIAGLGYQFLDNDTAKLSAEVGLGYQSQNYTVKSGVKDFEQAIGKFSGKFGYSFNPNVRFFQGLTEYYGEKQANFESNTGLKVKLADNLNMKVSYKYRYNSAPAAGKVKEDTESMITMIYDF